MELDFIRQAMEEHQKIAIRRVTWIELGFIKVVLIGEEGGLCSAVGGSQHGLGVGDKKMAYSRV